MIRYISSKQFTISEELRKPFKLRIDKKNRCIKLSEKILYDEFADIYYLDMLSTYQKRKQKNEQEKRNQIDGKFEQGKNTCNLNKTRTCTSKTSESCITCIKFVMNPVQFNKAVLFVALCVMFGINQINFFQVILFFICGIFFLSLQADYVELLQERLKKCLANGVRNFSIATRAIKISI